MNRMTIKYWQELPFLVGELKRANSQLIYDWQKLFNPARSYITSVNFEEVRIVFEGDYWKVATRMFQVFCQEYQVKLNLNTYMWLAMHTVIIKGSLMGDDEFNQYIRDNGGYDEVEEFVESNILVNWHGEDFELHYNHRDMEMLQRLGMEIMPNKYQYRSKGGYYLPIDIHIGYNYEITKWKRREGSDKSRYQITHSPMLTILGVEKSAIFDLAYYLYINEGLSELLLQWVDEPSKTEYKIQINNTSVYVKDVWKEENPEHISVARELGVLSQYELEAFKVQDIVRHSTFSEYGIELEDEYYSQLNLPPDKVIGGKHHIYGNKYSYEQLALGSGSPITVDAGGIKIKTPYEYVERGKYSEILLPLVNGTSYTKGVESRDLLDTDNRIVLGIKPLYGDKKEFSLEDLVECDDGSKIPKESYPKVEIDIESLGIDFTADIEVHSKRLTYTYSDFKYVPYLLTVEDMGDRLRVEYIDGVELDVPKSDENIRTRVVFQDRVGVVVQPNIENLTNLLLSLATDELSDVTGSEISGQEEATNELIGKWLQALVTGDSKDVYRSIKEYSIGDPSIVSAEDDDDDFDIFEDIGLV